MTRSIVSNPKSVITTDLEGRIETFNDGACAIFGYEAGEIIGKKRVSLFSPGLVVLAHVPRWLAEARERGEHRSRTVFVRKDGTLFAADVRITPTMKGGQQIGYCGVTTPRLDVDPKDAMPPIGLGPRIFRWLVITRAPFVSATVVPILVAAAWVHAHAAADAAFPWLAFVLALIGGVALHIAGNVWNDYFDWASGTDQANNGYFLPVSGGSRAIELGLVTPRGLMGLGIGALAVASLCGAWLLTERGLGLAAFGLAGAAAAWFYTAPPLRLVARRGLGELTIALAFGPLITGGVAYALAGRVTLGDWLIGVPMGLWTAAILFINEFPDAESDALTGKNHLVVTLGKRAARWGYLAIVAAAFVFIAAAALKGLFPMGSLLALAALPLAAWAVAILFRYYDDRRLVTANVRTIQLHAAAGLLLAAGLYFVR
jgi:1,4-dihydroxy-2-naphthoate octaprenyltransferase